MNLTIRAEDIMTPRRFLLHARTDRDAKTIAATNGFNAVPFISSDGSVSEFWNREKEARQRITRNHRVSYDVPIEKLLTILGEHIVQFVFYRSEMVGLIDASDLNKPRACLAWLEPMMELERAILRVVAVRKIGEDDQAKALGDQAKPTIKRQSKARKHDLMLPLLEYAQFPSLLRASRYLGITELSEKEIRELNYVRSRAAHGAGEPVIEDRSNCHRIQRTLLLARKTATTLSKD